MPSQQQPPHSGGAHGGAHSGNSGVAGGGEEHFEYEGAAVQTAPNAFGNVASVAGGLAGGIVKGVRTVGMGSMGSVLGAVTPSRLAGGMASWRGRLADVVASTAVESQPNVPPGVGQMNVMQPPAGGQT